MTEEQLKSLVSQILENMNGNDAGKAAEASKDGKTPEFLKSRTTTDDGMIADIREEDYTSTLEVDNAVNPEEFLRIKKQTDARIGIGRCGPRYKTKAYLRILADHAGALDAVQNEPPEHLIKENNLFPVQTMCENKDVYMTRPDLGRVFSDEMKAKIRENCIMNPDVQVIVSEGLSSTAMERNITDLLSSLEQGFKVEGIKSGTPIYVKYSRVPAMDVITEITKPKVTIILIGERPGLSTYASLSAYMTYQGKVGMSESGRNVVSNIHENGTNPVEAGAHIAGVVRKMLDQKASGTDLKLF